MPASSADSFDAIEQTLQATFNGPSTSCNELNIEEKVMGSAKKVLLSKIDFQPAEKSYSFTLKNLKSKYIHLNPDGKRNNCEMQNGNGFNHNANVSTDEDGIPNPKIMIHPADKVTLGWQRVYRIGAGLMNMGNTCFLNAILQCLTYTPPLVNHLIEFDEHTSYCKTVGFCMMCELFRHIRKAFEKNGETIKPQCILQKLKAIAKHMVWGRQEDAHEFLRYVMESMIKSSLKGYSPTNLDRISLETTVVNQIFGGYHRSQVICLQCKSKSDTYDHFMDIILDIKNVPSLEKAMEKFIQPEVLDKDNSYLCPRCKQKCPAQKRFTIHRAPNVATFQLKRFDYNRMVGGKITKTITFPEKLDLRPYMSQQHAAPVKYQLYAVLVHQGVSCNSGHYFCFVRNSNNLWYCMDDCRIRQVSLNIVLSQQAYLLFYTRLPNNNNYNCKPSTNNNLNNTTVNGNYDKRINSTVTANNINNNNNNNNNAARNRLGSGLITTNREKVSFGIKTQTSTSNLTDTDSKHPRIVMHIKHGKVTSYEQQWSTTNGDQQRQQAQQNLQHNQHNRVANLVPYIPDSSEESDQDIKNGKENVATTSATSASTTTTTTTTTLLQVESTHVENENKCDKTNPLAVTTTPMVLSGNNKIKATSSWVVTDGNQNSPSIASECSNNSVNSTTTDWIITENGEDKNQKGERNYPGWIVTANKENGDKCIYNSNKRLPHRLLGGKEKNEIKCHNDDSQLLINKKKINNKIIHESNKCHSDTETHLSHNRLYNYQNNNNKGVRNGKEEAEEERVPSLTTFEFGRKRGRHKDDEDVGENGHKNEENEVKKIKCSKEESNSTMNGYRSDSNSESSSIKRRKKRRKENRERFKGQEEGNQSENSENSSTQNRLKKRKRKHKRQDHDSEDASDESSYELEWVERTKETVEEERKWNKTNDRRQTNWQDRFNNKDSHRNQHQLHHWGHNGVSDLFKNSHQGYGAKVNSWNGGQSSLDRESSPWKRRNNNDDYDAEYDKGRVKRNKCHRRHFDSGFNPFQRYQTVRNNSDQTIQDRASSFHSFGRKGAHYHNNNYNNHHLKQHHHHHIKHGNKF